MTQRKGPKMFTATDYSVFDEYEPRRVGKIAVATAHLLVERAFVMAPHDPEARITNRVLKAAEVGMRIARTALELEKGLLSSPEEVDDALGQLRTLGDWQDFALRVLDQGTRGPKS